MRYKYFNEELEVIYSNAKLDFMGDAAVIYEKTGGETAEYKQGNCYYFAILQKRNKHMFGLRGAE